MTTGSSRSAGPCVRRVWRSFRAATAPGAPRCSTDDGIRAGDLLNRDFRTTAPNCAWAGFTDTVALHGISASIGSDVGESVLLDLRYVDNWSPALDMMILWKTLRRHRTPRRVLTLERLLNTRMAPISIREELTGAIR